MHTGTFEFIRCHNQHSAVIAAEPRLSYTRCKLSADVTTTENA